MKKIYVTELSFTGKDIVDKRQVLSQHGHTGWTAADIYELLVDMDDISDYIDDPWLALKVDNKELAQWLSSSDLVNYDKAHTTDEEAVDFSYDNEAYHLVFLVREVLADFIIDTIEKSLDNKGVDFPSGIELY